MDVGKIKVGAVSYLNAKPLLYGFEKGEMNDLLEWSLDYPSAIAEQLLSRKIDIGLVPVAIIPQLPEYRLVGHYCIGAVGEVSSVCLFSDVPLEQIDCILLDYQSRTSVALLKILLRDHWKIAPLLLEAKPGYEQQIGGKTAGLVIGDRALEQKMVAAYCYDLALAWYKHTGLPFVFAAWISNRPMDQGFVEAFDRCNALGMNALHEIAARYPLARYDLLDYFENKISYTLDDAKIAGLQRFLSLIS